MDSKIVRVIVDSPIAEPLDYLNDRSTDYQIGQRCLVPLGNRTVVGIIVGFEQTSRFADNRLKPVKGLLDDVPPLNEKWLHLTSFASRYYQSTWGQVAVPALPKFFRKIPGKNHLSSLKRLRNDPLPESDISVDLPVLNDEQQKVVNQFATKGFHAGLLFGITGSGKTEVYLRLIQKVLDEDPDGQILLMVPEINLTPQLVSRVQARFPNKLVSTWNSGMSEGAKAKSWLSCHEMRTRILVGTRLSVFASLPKLSLIIVDEEHDTSFKSLEGVRYSSRDLAVKRAQIQAVPVLLGSATPSFETLLRALSGQYSFYELTKRASENAVLPKLELVDVSKEKRAVILSPIVADAITQTLQKKEQVLVFLNRRGYAPVVTCRDCGWTSMCPHCSVYAVFHKTTGHLTCHYCGWSMPLPRSCPKCGSVELAPVGRGTQRVEEEISRLWPEARIARLDQDTTTRKGSAEQVLSAVHKGEIDILLGTQIVAKGHDFKKVSLVVILNSDALLMSADFKSRERLFSVLMQVSGRAGRGDIPGRVMLQTRYVEDDLFSYLEHQDYKNFALSELKARERTGLPPYSAQALLVAEGKELSKVLAFLSEAKQKAQSLASSQIRIYDPVPQAIVKIQDIERAQLLFEADSKPILQAFLREFDALLKSEQRKFYWYLDVDPINY